MLQAIRRSATGGETYFKTLDDLYNALQTNNQTAVQSSITLLDNATNQVSNVRADVGARMNYLETLKSAQEDRSVTFQGMLSNTEDTDIASTVSELAKIQVSLEALRTSGAKMLSQSLLDFLQ